MMRRRRASRQRCGFTLVEVIAAAVVLAALSSVGASILFVAIDSYVEASAASQLHSEASIAIDRIVREMRDVDLDPDAGGIAPDIEDVTNTYIMWNNTSLLLWSGDRLDLRVGTGPSNMLVDGVSDFRIRVYDESDNLLSLPRLGASCDPIRRVGFSITLTESGVSETVRTKQFLRCTMSRAGLP